MKTHTIRNKSKSTPIISFTPEFFKELLDTNMDTIALVIAKFNMDYKKITGKTPSLDYDQQVEVYQKFLGTSDTNKMWTSKYSSLPKLPKLMHTMFVDGLMNSSIINMDESLPIITEFFNMLDQTYAPILAQQELLGPNIE